MATILEGLNAISQAVGGTAEAENNLEALNAISAALGGSADAETNADAIANIAENASGGGGGSSDFSTAEVTLTCTTEGNYFETSKVLLIEYNKLYIASMHNDDAPYEMVLYKGLQEIEIYSPTRPVISGSATFIEQGEELWVYDVTGDCEIFCEGYPSV